MRNRMFLLLFVTCLGLWLAVLVSASSLVVEEADLTASGEVYEINPGPAGELIISDSGTGEIWRVESSGTYTVYESPFGAVDAKPDGDGDLWWTDGAPYFGRVSVSTWSRN